MGGTASLFGAVGIGLFLAASGAVPRALAAEAGLSDYQGAWLMQGSSCTEVYSSAGKGASFKKPVDIFAPAFIIAGNRLRTPMASCRIKSLRPTGERQTLSLECANSVAAQEVRVQMAKLPDGTIKRYFHDEDAGGTSYQRCSQ